MYDNNELIHNQVKYIGKCKTCGNELYSDKQYLIYDEDLFCDVVCLGTELEKDGLIKYND